ncbi:Hypothetical protein A7982_09009 [Minicystis rosea]|nr:Hypothetical protein A7982_09009 [Minicystis rosea]
MSSAHDAHGASAHAHDDHDVFDGEPAHELSPGEPRSPNWLPALGLALFTLAGVYMLSGGDSNATGLTPPRPLPVEPAALAVHAAPERPARAAPPVRADAAPPGSGSVRKLTPDQIEELRKKMEEARGKGAGPGAPSADAAAKGAPGKAAPAAKGAPAKGPAPKRK